MAGLGAFLGHLYPVWLKFQGGKGVATYLGILLAVGPLAGALTCLTWLVTALIFRMSSLSALVCSLAAEVQDNFVGLVRGDLRMQRGGVQLYAGQVALRAASIRATSPRSR